MDVKVGWVVYVGGGVKVNMGIAVHFGEVLEGTITLEGTQLTRIRLVTREVTMNKCFWFILFYSSLFSNYDLNRQQIVHNQCK